jgi:hypothetical protein
VRERLAIPREATPAPAMPAPAAPAATATPSPVGDVLRLQATAGNQATVGLLQRKANSTGMPDTLKAGIEQLSGMSMDDVRVHYSSPKPAQVQALAYAQGTDIHVGPGQERHLPHEAWHVVQQRQGRVRPTTSATGAPLADDPELSREADEMGRKAAEYRPPT